jgi:hypothetical protein
MARKRLRRERAEREAEDQLFGSPELGSKKPSRSKKKGF